MEGYLLNSSILKLHFSVEVFPQPSDFLAQLTFRFLIIRPRGEEVKDEHKNVFRINASLVIVHLEYLSHC